MGGMGLVGAKTLTMFLRGPRTEIKAAAAALLSRNADKRAFKLGSILRWEELAELCDG